MDKIKKALQSLTEKERKLIKQIISALQNNKFIGLNIQKLQGHKDIYRVRKGSLRIIYRQKDKVLSILAIERRSKKIIEITKNSVCNFNELSNLQPLQNSVIQ